MDRFPTTYLLSQVAVKVILGDGYVERYGEEITELEKRVNHMISECRIVIRSKSEIKAKDELERAMKVEATYAEQSVQEINGRRATLLSKMVDAPDKLGDQQLLDLSKTIGDLDREGNEIRERYTSLKLGAPSLTVVEAIGGVDATQKSALDAKDSFVKVIRQELAKRDLSDEKIKNALGLKV